jgi:hypothetical protein
MPSVFDIPEDELTPDQEKLRQALTQTSQAQEQAAADRAVTAHLNTRVVALRARLNEAEQRVAELEARKRPGSAGAGKPTPRKAAAKKPPAKTAEK